MHIVARMNGLPLHPLLVHLPVVLIPLVALLTVPTLVSRRWFQWSAPFTLGLALLAALGSWFATWSGEDLEARLGESSALLEQHAQLGEMTRNLAFLTLMLLAVHVALFWRRSPAATRAFGENRPVVHTVLAVLTLVAALAGVVVAIQAGHAGAQLVWLGAA